MSNLEVVFATNNPAKAQEVQQLATAYDIKVLQPTEAGFPHLDPDETGKTYQENAALKVDAYRTLPGAENFIILGDDTGLEIETLGGEPGIHTRRWANYRMTDDEIVGYALGRMKGKRNRSATFRTAVAYSVQGGEIQFTEGELRGFLVDHPFTRYEGDEGAPLRRLFMIDSEPPIPLTEFHRQSLDYRRGRMTHREMAFARAFTKFAAEHAEN